MKHILVILLLLPCSLWSRNAARVANGSDWKQYSQTYKIGWIDGWATAMINAQISTSMLCAFQLNVKLESEEGKACVAAAQSFNFEMITFGQFLEGMDTFYKDFRNTEMPINMAIRIVHDQINGRPAEDIEKELIAWRQCDADGSKCGTSASPKQAAPATKTPPAN